MKKILVPVDFSDLSDKALDFAIETSKAGDMQVEVLHVIEISGASLYGQDLLGTSHIWLDTYINDMKESAKTRMETLKSKHQYKNLNTRIELGYPYTHISKTVAEVNADLVIMGSHGDSGLHGVLVGSNAEKVARECSCPVLVIKNSLKVAQIKNIAAGLHWRETPEKLIVRLKQLQKLFNAHLSIVWVNTPTDFERDHFVYPALEDMAKKYELTNFSLNIYNDYFEEEGLRNFTSKVKADMIAIGTHGRSGLANYISGSVAGELVNESKLPIWSFRIKN